MSEEQRNYQITLDGGQLEVAEHYIKDERVFHVTFPDKRKPLVIAVAESGGKKFWTSVPQGRQKEAETIGRQITLYYRSLKGK